MTTRFLNVAIAALIGFSGIATAESHKVWDLKAKENIQTRHFIQDGKYFFVRAEEYIHFFDGENGKEIWEGDIVYHHHFNEKGVMEFYEKQSAFMLKYCSDGKHESMFPIDSQCFEVLGNIYEHSDILEKQDG